MSSEATVLGKLIVSHAKPINHDSDHAELIERAGNSKFVLIGESSHGTHEFYETRAEITKKLIAEKGFCAVAVEADFPDAFRINRFVRGISRDADAAESLSDFSRFPAWMWANTVVHDFVDWLHKFNGNISNDKTIGFYGMDLYSLRSSIGAVLSYLDNIDPEAAERARQRYSCFDHFGEDTQSYGYAAGLGIAETCEDEVVDQLLELRGRAAEFDDPESDRSDEDFFFVEQNARVVKNAEQYYRLMYRSDVSSWNLRDRHMFETLVELDQHLSRTGREPKIVVWAHNSHLGDARATDMSSRGELNVGELMRKKFPGQVFLIGFTTYTGSVTAATDWGGSPRIKAVRPGLRGSIEEVFHNTGLESFTLTFDDDELKTSLQRPLLERAIGVIYRPETERQSHYFHARLADQFDAVIHIDRTTAIEPLATESGWEAGEALETFPTGI